jgi:osmotically inducible protein OsmC
VSIAERRSETLWTGPLATGSGTITSGSGALGELPVTWASRTVRPDGKTSPEELAAAAHSSCFSMALALTLGEHKAEPARLQVGATVTLDAVDGVPTIVSSAITVDATVPGITAEQFGEILDEAAKLCPISRLFAGAQITVESTFTPVDR